MSRSRTSWPKRSRKPIVARTAQPHAFCLIYGASQPDALAAVRRGLDALSEGAAREQAGRRCSPILASLGHVDDAWRNLEDATTTAERLGDPSLLGRVLVFKAAAHSLCLELEAVRDTGQRALPLLRTEALWDRAELMMHMTVASCRRGRFAEVDAVLAELEPMASRVGHHEALGACALLRHLRELMLTGDLRAWLSQTEQVLQKLLPVSQLVFLFNRAGAASTRLYLGEIENALEQLAAMIVDSGPVHVYKAMAEANLFAALALAGRIDRARTLFQTVAPRLPVLGRRNLQGAWHPAAGRVVLIRSGPACRV